LEPQLAARERLAFALDVTDLDEARWWISLLAGHIGVFKVGLELFVRSGPGAVALVRDAGARCFLDLKLHDIPETVARAVSSAAAHGADYLTLHASGGRAMLARAAAAAASAPAPPHLLAVTVLTSLDDAAVAEIGLGPAAGPAASRLASLALDSGVSGLVCSAHEVASLRAALPGAFLVTPGIRPAGSARGDQARVATAGDAIRAGADLLVVGRPIRDAADPVAAARAIVREIEDAAS
jgi:orotidine-5'-phosphate decarboxylase